jgi:hypothetical protein
MGLKNAVQQHFYPLILFYRKFCSTSQNLLDPLTVQFKLAWIELQSVSSLACVSS